MSYGRLGEAERKLDADVAALLGEAQRVDAAEDAQAGSGQRGEELPAELARRTSRLAKLRAVAIADWPRAEHHRFHRQLDRLAATYRPILQDLAARPLELQAGGVRR